MSRTEFYIEPKHISRKSHHYQLSTWTFVWKYSWYLMVSNSYWTMQDTTKSRNEKYFPFWWHPPGRRLQHPSTVIIQVVQWSKKLTWEPRCDCDVSTKLVRARILLSIFLYLHISSSAIIHNLNHEIKINIWQTNK